jgi:hypothetical protein
MNEQNLASPPHEGNQPRHALGWARLAELSARAAAIVATLPGPNVANLGRRWRDRAAELRIKADALAARCLHNSARVPRSCAIVLEVAERDLRQAIERDAEGCPPTTRTGERPAKTYADETAAADTLLYD